MKVERQEGIHEEPNTLLVIALVVLFILIVMLIVFLLMSGGWTTPSIISIQMYFGGCDQARR